MQPPWYWQVGIFFLVFSAVFCAAGTIFFYCHTPKKAILFALGLLVSIGAMVSAQAAMTKAYPTGPVSYTFCGTMPVPEGTIVVIAQEGGWCSGYLTCHVYKLPLDLKLNPGDELDNDQVQALWQDCQDKQLIRSDIIGDR